MTHFRLKSLLSVADKLLVAALSLENKGSRVFTAEELVVAAWSNYPDTFGLSGFQDKDGAPLYPDSNRVFVEIMGSKPVRKRGFLVKTGEKQYGLTETGRQRGQMLLERTHESQTVVGKRGALGREVIRQIERLVTSRAFKKFSSGEIDSITFHDACVFWGVSPHSSAIELGGKLANVLGTIRTGIKASRLGNVATTHGDVGVSKREMDLLERLHNIMLERFDDELRTIQRRVDQRKW